MRKALIVDDHPFIRRIVRLVLENANFQIAAETDNGATALDLAREHLPHLIVLDLSMPKLDGLEVLKRLHILGLGGLKEQVQQSVNFLSLLSETIPLPKHRYQWASDRTELT